MKATEAKLLEFIKKSPQFVIPIYQRAYSWTDRECRQFWDDIIRTGENDEIKAHFVGSIVYIEKGIYQVTSQSPLLVIDGQQRLTTLSLLLAALANRLDDLPQGKQEIIEGFSPRKLRNYYLLNPEEDGERHYKLILSKTDKESLIAVIDNKEIPKDAFIKIVRFIEAYVFRRAICAIPTNSLNKTFATFMKSVDKNNYLESVMAQFMLLPSYRGFPNDGEFIKEFRTRDLYNIPRRSY